MEGDFPASFKQLQNETKFLLEEFRKINPKIDYKFIDPIATKMSQDTLQAVSYTHLDVYKRQQELLEITIYKGTKNNGANSLFGLKVGDKIYIQFELSLIHI